MVHVHPLAYGNKNYPALKLPANREGTSRIGNMNKTRGREIQNIYGEKMLINEPNKRSIHNDIIKFINNFPAGNYF